MGSTPLILCAMGVLGVLLQSLVKMDSLNRQSNGNFKLMPYLKLERFSIIISLIVVLCSTIASQEIKQLNVAGNYLALGFVMHRVHGAVHYSLSLWVRLKRK